MSHLCPNWMQSWKVTEGFPDKAWVNQVASSRAVSNFGHGGNVNRASQLRASTDLSRGAHDEAARWVGCGGC